MSRTDAQNGVEFIFKCRNGAKPIAFDVVFPHFQIYRRIINIRIIITRDLNRKLSSFSHALLSLKTYYSMHDKYTL
jgi:hypothetical protein